MPACMSKLLHGICAAFHTCLHMTQAEILALFAVRLFSAVTYACLTCLIDNYRRKADHETSLLSDA